MAKRVLVIDDEPNTLKYVSAVLAEHGYDAITAGDGGEGLKKLEEAEPDLIILDVMMPSKSGLTLFKQLKKDDRYKEIPILMLTGVAGVIEELDSQKEETAERPYDSLRETLKKAIQAMREHGQIRPEMFVDKPVDPEPLIARVRELIGG